MPITDSEILKVIFTDPIWLKKFLREEESFIDNVFRLASDNDKYLLARTINKTLYQVATNLTKNFNLNNKTGLAKVAIDRFLPEKDGARDLTFNHWAWVIWFGKNINSFCPRYSDCGRDVDGLFAWIYGCLYIYGEDFENKKNKFFSFIDKEGPIDNCDIVKFLDKTPESYSHVNLFDDSIFASLYLDNKKYDDVKLFFSELKQKNISASIRVINDYDARKNFPDENTYIIGKYLSENESYQVACKRASFLNGKFGYEINQEEDSDLKKNTLDRIKDIYTDEICAKYYNCNSFLDSNNDNMISNVCIILEKLGLERIEENYPIVEARYKEVILKIQENKFNLNRLKKTLFGRVFNNDEISSYETNIKSLSDCEYKLKEILDKMSILQKNNINEENIVNDNNEKCPDNANNSKIAIFILFLFLFLLSFTLKYISFMIAANCFLFCLLLIPLVNNFYSTDIFLKCFNKENCVGSGGFMCYNDITNSKIDQTYEDNPRNRPS